MSKEVTTYDSPKDALLDSLEAPPLDPIILSIANNHLAGYSAQKIAEDLQVTPDIVTQVLDRKDVKNYVDHVYMNQGYMRRQKRIELINMVIEQKVKEAIESGDNLSKKDLHDWIKILNEMDRDIKPKDKSPSVAVQVNSNYEILMRDLLEDK